ncbi:MAG: dihydrolipoyl dehydrogenase [Candidatus Omnitrophica bacterium]|nr:dihydrolipoyl dehydrogenase [Candidatus Omnitrophota bacterium]
MYDLVIIGAGWAGFNAALKAKELGLKVCLIEQSNVGGTCLNKGCIPTKTLIQSAKVFALTKKLHSFGIEAGESKLIFSRVQERKDSIIDHLQKGMKFMLKGIDFINSKAEFLSSDEVSAGSQNIKSEYFLIATGSEAIELPFMKFDSKRIISSDEILNLKELPDTLLIVGGGVIGCEFASLFSTLGSKVTIVEKMMQLLPQEDKEISRRIELSFKKKNIIIHTNTDVRNLNLSEYALALVCVGRSPTFKGLKLENAGLKIENNKITVDDYLRTSVKNIYAAGDCTGKTMLAHYASYQGEIAALNIAKQDQPKKADNKYIPNCIFTDPEIGSVGLNEETAKAAGIEISVKKFDFLASGMARILDETEGFIKIICNNKTDEIIGASILGPRATELIGILTLAASCKLRPNVFSDIVFAHPTLTESIGEILK